MNNEDRTRMRRRRGTREGMTRFGETRRSLGEGGQPAPVCYLGNRGSTDDAWPTAARTVLALARRFSSDSRWVAGPTGRRVRVGIVRQRCHVIPPRQQAVHDEAALAVGVGAGRLHARRASPHARRPSSRGRDACASSARTASPAPTSTHPREDHNPRVGRIAGSRRDDAVDHRNVRRQPDRDRRRSSPRRSGSDP